MAKKVIKATISDDDFRKEYEATKKEYTRLGEDAIGYATSYSTDDGRVTVNSTSNFTYNDPNTFDKALKEANLEQMRRGQRANLLAGESSRAPDQDGYWVRISLDLGLVPNVAVLFEVNGAKYREQTQGKWLDVWFDLDEIDVGMYLFLY